MKALLIKGIISGLLICGFSLAAPAQLKSIVYDFDGFDLNATSLPEGDYQYGDLAYQVVANPLAASEMLGDRVLKMSIHWSAGYGAFGRGISRYLELSQNQDALNFYFYNPAINNQPATFEVAIADDDNQSNAYESGSDDSWRKTFTITSAPGWQLYSTPLSDFTDSNAGGNGIFDVAFTQNKGMLLLVEFRFSKSQPALSDPVFYLDMICFSEGALPHGASVTDLPQKSPGDYCLLGAHHYELPGEYYKIPTHFEGLFPSMAGRKLKYVNTYLQWGTDGTPVAKALPGAGYQTLLDNGYTPILTWEPQFKGYPPLDPVQPRLDNIINGDYNNYLDNFADKMKTYSDTIIIRFMHEFDGDWYPWCISQNGGDPAKFVLAFQKVVQRFKARGATRVKWMWCPNNSSTPNASYNWIVQAYPGDSFVDIVATDLYNAHYPASLPWWRSFRWQLAETYYYLTRYIPDKPVFIGELACRERQPAEEVTSQSKAGWFEKMDKALQSDFHLVRAIVFFDESKDQNWAVNTSPGAMQSLTENIWKDDYYFVVPKLPVAVNFQKPDAGFYVFPNPAGSKLCLVNEEAAAEQMRIRLLSTLGECVLELFIDLQAGIPAEINLGSPAPGIYVIETTTAGKKMSRKLIIN
jgi:hypothetical protein